MKLKSLAVGMILPLIGTIALSTAPAASAAPFTSHTVGHVSTYRNRDRAYSNFNHRERDHYRNHYRNHYRDHHRTDRHRVHYKL